MLVDTSAFYALLDDRDPRHHDAVEAWSQLAATRAALITHEYVIVEAISLIQSRLGMSVLQQFVDNLLPLVDVTWVDAALHHQVREAMRSAGRRGVSFVDWTSFIVMRKLEITTTFAFDADFAAQGFEVIPAPAA